MVAIHAKPNTQATCAAKPAVFLRTHKRASLNVSSTTINDVTWLDPIPPEPDCIFFGNPSDPVFNDPIVTNVGRHNRRNAFFHVVGCVQLAPERAGLNAAASSLASFA